MSVDNDFSCTAEVKGLVKQVLKIEMEKIQTETKNKEKVVRSFSTRFDREEREDD